MTRSEYQERMDCFEVSGLVTSTNSIYNTKNYRLKKGEDTMIEIHEGAFSNNGEPSMVMFNYYKRMETPTGRLAKSWTHFLQHAYKYFDLDSIIINNGQVRVTGTMIIE